MKNKALAELPHEDPTCLGRLLSRSCIPDSPGSTDWSLVFVSFVKEDRRRGGVCLWVTFVDFILTYADLCFSLLFVLVISS